MLSFVVYYLLIINLVNNNYWNIMIYLIIMLRNLLLSTRKTI